MKPIPTSKRTANRLGLWRDVQDIAMMQLDALLILVLGALVLLPIIWATAGDLALLAAYVVILALAAFVLIYLALIFIDRRVAAIDAKVTAAGERQRAGKKR